MLPLGDVPTLDDSRAERNLQEQQVQGLVIQMRKQRAREETGSQTQPNQRQYLPNETRFSDSSFRSFSIPHTVFLNLKRKFQTTKKKKVVYAEQMTNILKRNTKTQDIFNFKTNRPLKQIYANITNQEMSVNLQSGKN